MSRKRPASAIVEPNNNDNDTQSMDKKRRTMTKRLMAQLESDFTEKMITPLKSPNGQPTSRFGRTINKIDSQNSSPRKRKSITPSHADQYSNQKRASLSKRKTQLTNTTENSINSNSTSTEPEINDVSTDVSLSDATNFVTVKTDYGSMESNNDLSSTDFEKDDDCEDKLTKYVISSRVIDEIDLTSSTEGSERGDDTKSNHSDDTQSKSYSTCETYPMAHRLNASQEKTDSPKKITEPDGADSGGEMISISASNSDLNLFNDDKSFLEGKSDDCVITGYVDESHNSDVCSTDDWHVGQIVWAAIFGYPFWPAIIFNEKESQTFRKDNQIHVKFLYDNGRRNWVNENNNNKTSILPFKNREEFLEKCKLPVNKRSKAYRINKCKKWELAVDEANVLSCIKLEKRVEFYDIILLKIIHKSENELRSNRRKTGDRCDTPQTFDTAYSSMKQSSSPASLSPTLNELDRNYDVDKNINNYLISVELSRPEKLPEEDLQMDETQPSPFAASVVSLSLTEPIGYFRLTKLAYEMFDDITIPIDQSAISNEIQFVSNLNELWSKITDAKLAKSSANSSLVKKRESRLSLDSTMSHSSSFTHQQLKTKRQRIIAQKQAALEQEQQLRKSKTVEKNIQVVVKPTKEEIYRKKLQQAEEIIRDCYIKNHPANYLLKGLSKDPVCQSCLQNGHVTKCAGKCNTFFHNHCFSSEINESEYYGMLKRKMRKTNEETSTNNEAATCVTENIKQLMCVSCTSSSLKLHCFVCKKLDANCIQCCDKNCGKVYHIDCLKYWPQHKKEYINNNIKSLHCPRHVCHTCVSPDIRSMFHHTESDKKLIKCLLCPGTYHRSSECIPAGSELLSETQLICARHQIKNGKRINIDYCLFCSKGGCLICCDACPNSFHQDCLKVPIGDHFNCEECESGRRPLNGEIVWCKYHVSKWWPSIIVPPPRIPDNVLSKKKEPNQICVYFFGTHEYGWVSQANIYLYLREDGEYKNKTDGPSLKNAVDEANYWMKIFAEINEKNSKTLNKSNKPPPYKKIKTNKVIAKFKEQEYTECKCHIDDLTPCSTESDCWNVATQVECDPDLCPAKDKCQNQKFHQGEKFAFDIKMTESKGWGLYAKETIPMDEFIIEYMGEVIDNHELNQRFSRATSNKDDNYYFLKLGNLYIDAKLYGNEARFINHSCDPNAKPVKWTVYSNGQAFNRIGFFALRKILPGEELTFDYNWGTKKMETVCVCQCGSQKCRGHI